MEKIVCNISEAFKQFFMLLKSEGLITNVTLNCELKEKFETVQPLVECSIKKYLIELIGQLNKIKADIESMHQNHRNGEIQHVPKVMADTGVHPLPHPKFVQICVSKVEMERRISSFTARKRKEVDELNIHEFCSREAIDESNPDWEFQVSCARVDAINMPRYGSRSHRKVSKVENIWGPQTRPKPSKDEVINKEVLTKSGIEERLLAMESHLKIKSNQSFHTSVYSRLQHLENRILYLEGISPDYFNTGTKRISSTINVTKKTELQKKYENSNLEAIDKRLKELTESLNQKKKFCA